MQHWLVAYLITCAVEIPIIMAMVRGLHWRSTAAHPLLDLAAMAWALQLTHPILWLVNPVFPAGTAVAEALIVLVEAGCIYWWAAARAGISRGTHSHWWCLLIAFTANAASFLLGLLLVLL